MPTPTIEEYLEAIYALTEDGSDVIGARLADTLGVSPPTVTATLQRMVRDGLVTMGDHKAIGLSDKGLRAAEVLVRRHRLVERLLVDVLGVAWHDVHEEACLLEHAVSPRIEERLVSLLGDPRTCPHGNAIPGKAGDENQIRLLTSRPGDEVTVKRVAQRAESETGLLKYLVDKGLVPGTRIKVMEIAPFNGPVVLRVGQDEVSVSRDVAAVLWVTPDDD